MTLGFIDQSTSEKGWRKLTTSRVSQEWEVVQEICTRKLQGENQPY